MQALIVLVNSTYDKLSFAGGAIFMLVSIFCAKPITLWKIRLPAIDGYGRIMSGIVGGILLLWTMFVWTTNNLDIGIFSTKPTLTSRGNEVSHIFFSAAVAANDEIVLQQYRPHTTALPGGEIIGLYADNIRPRSPSRLVLFVPNNKINPHLGKKTTYNELIKIVGRENIVFEADVVQNQSYQFNWGSAKSIKIERILWYVVGTDYMVLQIH